MSQRLKTLPEQSFETPKAPNQTFYTKRIRPQNNRNNLQNQYQNQNNRNIKIDTQQSFYDDQQNPLLNMKSPNEMTTLHFFDQNQSGPLSTRNKSYNADIKHSNKKEVNKPYNFTSFKDAQEQSISWEMFASKYIDNQDECYMTKQTLDYNQAEKDKIQQIIQKNANQQIRQFRHEYDEEQKKSHCVTRIRLQPIYFNNVEGLSQNQSKTNSQNPTKQENRDKNINNTLNKEAQKINDKDVVSDPKNNTAYLQQLMMQSSGQQCIKLHVYQMTNTNRQPEVREQATLSLWKDRLFLIGGVGRKVINVIDELNLNNYRWCNDVKEKGDMHDYGKFGHSCCFYKKGFLVFGGQREMLVQMKQVNCGNDLKYLDPSSNAWTNLKLYGDIIEGRRNQAAAVVGRFLFIIGGMNNFFHYLKDIYAIDLESKKTKELEVQGGFDKGLAFHTALPIYKGQVSLDKPTGHIEHKKFQNERVFRNVQEEGIYIFGGKTENGKALNTLYILKIGCEPIKLTKPQTHGVQPLARYQHTMNYWKTKNIIIIVGGRNDRMSQANQKSNQQSIQKSYQQLSQQQTLFNPFNSKCSVLPQKECLRNYSVMNDVSILNVENLNWITVQLQGLPLQPIYSHSAEIVDSKLIIFGGFNDTYYNNANIRIIELDPSNCSKFKQQKVQKMSVQELEFSIQEEQNSIFYCKNLEKSNRKWIAKMDTDTFVRNQDASNGMMDSKGGPVPSEKKEDPNSKNPNFKHRMSIKTFQPLPPKVLHNIQQNQNNNQVNKIISQGRSQNKGLLSYTQLENNTDDEEEEEGDGGSKIDMNNIIIETQN